MVNKELDDQGVFDSIVERYVKKYAEERRILIVDALKFMKENLRHIDGLEESFNIDEYLEALMEKVK
jgi:hypothetical protein